MTFLQNKRRGVILRVLVLLIITGITIFLVYRANFGDILSRSRQFVAIANLWGPFKAGQQVKVIPSYYPSVLLQSLAANEQQKEVLFCNLKPDGSPAYQPSAYKARMDQNAKCLSGYMEATKLREQRGVIQGNLGTAEAMLAALSMTEKELVVADDYGFSVINIPSGTFLPTQVQYASNIQMKCVVDGYGGKSPAGIGTVQNLNTSTFAVATPESVTRFKALEKRIAALVKNAQDMMANGFNAVTMVKIIGGVIGLKSEMLAASIPLSPAAVQKYYRSILASGPTGSISMGINRDENNMRTDCKKDIPFAVDVLLAPPYYRGSIGLSSMAESIGFSDVCLPTGLIVKEIKGAVVTQSQRFFKIRTSLEGQLRVNSEALKRLEDTNYNCGGGSEK